MPKVSFEDNCPHQATNTCGQCPFCLLNKLCTYSVHRGCMTTCSKAFFTSSIRLIMRNWQANHVSVGTIKNFLREFSQNSAIVTWWFRMYRHTHFALLIKSLNWSIFVQSSNMRSNVCVVQPCLKTWGYVVTMLSIAPSIFVALSVQIWITNLGPTSSIPWQCMPLFSCSQLCQWSLEKCNL
jgi:hypothetical protein